MENAGLSEESSHAATHDASPRAGELQKRSKIQKAPPPIVRELTEKLDEAFKRGRAGDTAGAVALFHEIRCFADKPPLREAADALFLDYRRTNIAERERFRTFVARRNPPGARRRLVVLAGSLAMPRPKEPFGHIDGVPTSYPVGIQDRFRSTEAPVAVEAMCQRYATTDSFRRYSELVELEGADLLVHVGHNDFAVRMFLERQRIALKLLPTDLVQRITRFCNADNFRRHIVEAYDGYCYVPLVRWKRNIEEIVATARVKGARSVTFTNIVQVPSGVEEHTPSYRRNLLTYNLVLYEAAFRKEVRLIDTDRLIWENGFAQLMLPDQMHLSPAGHGRMVDWIAQHIFGES